MLDNPLSKFCHVYQHIQLCERVACAELSTSLNQKPNLIKIKSKKFIYMQEISKTSH